MGLVELRGKTPELKTILNLLHFRLLVKISSVQNSKTLFIVTRTIHTYGISKSETD